MTLALQAGASDHLSTLIVDEWWFTLSWHMNKISIHVCGKKMYKIDYG